MMSLKLLFGIFGTILIAILLLVGMVLVAGHPNDKKNGFKRTLDEKTQIVKASYNTSYPIARILGLTNSHIYISSINPRVVFSFDYTLKKIDSILIPFSLNASILANYQYVLSKNNFSLYAGNTSKRFSFQIGDTLVKSSDLESTLFTQVVELPSGTSIIKAFDSTRTKQIIQKLDRSGSIIKNLDLFGEQKDGGFSTDGILVYDEIAQFTVFLHFYENKFYCLDSSLNIKYIGRTIDTTQSNKISTKVFLKGEKPGGMLPAVPLSKINRESCAYNGKLYIISSLRADNEYDVNFENNSVIDIYNLSNGEYIKSIYIPKSENKQIKMIRLISNTLVAVYPNQITVFELNNNE